MVIVRINAEPIPGLTVAKISDEAGVEITNAASRLAKRIVANQEAVGRY
jgi:hypothetical protein